MNREAIVAEARSWLKTPWHHEQAIKGVGVDCAHFLHAVFVACGIPMERIEHYPRDWHLHRDEERFMEFVLRYGDEIPKADLQPADIVLWRIGRCYSHGAIYLGADEVIHAVMKVRMVCTSYLWEEELQHRLHRCFRLRGIDAR